MKRVFAFGFCLVIGTGCCKKDTQSPLPPLGNPKVALLAGAWDVLQINYLHEINGVVVYHDSDEYAKGDIVYTMYESMIGTTTGSKSTNYSFAFEIINDSLLSFYFKGSADTVSYNIQRLTNSHLDLVYERNYMNNEKDIRKLYMQKH